MPSFFVVAVIRTVPETTRKSADLCFPMQLVFGCLCHLCTAGERKGLIFLRPAWRVDGMGLVQYRYYPSTSM
jgi:hypothetical protein